MSMRGIVGLLEMVFVSVEQAPPLSGETHYLSWIDECKHLRRLEVDRFGDVVYSPPHSFITPTAEDFIMPATKLAVAAHASTSGSVPMLDVSRENGRLRSEIDAAIAEVCDAGAFVHGPACARFEAAMAEYCGSEHAVGCASGSDALLLALAALGIGPGDEVIVPSFTFFATASTVWRLGAKPVFADIRPDSFNLDPADVLDKLSTETKAIIPVHLFGQCAEMDELRQIATAARGIPIIEDACQAIGAEYKGQRAGSIGTMGALQLLSDKEFGRIWRRRADHDQRRASWRRSCACCAITDSSRGITITSWASTAGSTRCRRPC